MKISIFTLSVLLAPLNMVFNATQATSGLKSVAIVVALWSVKANVLESDSPVDADRNSLTSCTPQLTEQLQVIGELPSLLAIEGEMFEYKVPVNSIFNIPEECDASISAVGPFSLFEWATFDESTYTLLGVPKYPSNSGYYVKFVAQVMDKHVVTRSANIRVLGKKNRVNRLLQMEEHHEERLQKEMGLQSRSQEEVLEIEDRLSSAMIASFIFMTISSLLMMIIGCSYGKE